MNFNEHSNLEGLHAFLSPSNYHWLNYDEDKLIKTRQNYDAAKIGTRYHAFACECILLGQKLPKSKKTLNMYVNDAIGYKMTPEQILYFSENCFGTADAISYRKNALRIFDYKSGTTPASMKQVEIYAAIFCLEYNVNPKDIETIDLRIYQNDEVFLSEPEPEEITEICNHIIFCDKVLNEMKGAY